MRLLAALLLFIPLAASATIYQWTDEQGHVVIGNQVPEAARDVRPVMKEDATPASSNRELEERIARLERQLQAAQAAPAPYPAPVAPMPADYYGGAPYYPGMYPPPPPYYPYGYGYGYPFGAVIVVRPVHRFARVAHFRPVVTHFASRPVVTHFASRSVAMHHAAVGRR